MSDLANRSDLADILRNFVLTNSEVYRDDSQDLLRTIALYKASGLAALSPSEREELRSVYADRFFNLIR